MIQKFRPALSAPQINILISKLSFGVSKEEDKLKSYLQTFQVKIGNSLVSAGYEAKEKISVEESIGFSEEDSKESRREIAANKYISNPASCTKTECEDAYNHFLSKGEFPSKEIETKLETIVFNF